MHLNDGSRDDMELSKVPLTTLYRWYMYDMNDEEPNKHLGVFDITPVSQEGDEKEREESDVRTERLAPLIPFINLYANMNAQYIFEMQKQDLIESNVISAEKLEEDHASLKKLYKQITFSGLLTMLSSALELGLITTDGAITDID
jgi:hypothetical protein